MANPSQLYLESGGYLHFEAEDAQATGDWQLNTSLDGYSGTGYLEWTGENYFSKADAGKGITTYHFRIETAGNYEFRWRSRIARGDSNTESNDSWVRFTTGANVADEQALNGWTKVYMGEAGVWSWSARTVDEHAETVRQFFSQGDHTLEISGRSNGHAIDRIALYRYADVNFDPGLNGTLPLSSYLQEGSMVDPNPLITPSPETTLAERVNATPIAANTSESDQPLCTANTLTLSAGKWATLNTQSEPPGYNTNALTLEAGEHSVLIQYDLSAVPGMTSAHLEYTNDGSISNGTVNVFLASHNNWPNEAPNSPPDALLTVAEAKGGWESRTRYSTQLDAASLPQGVMTLLLSLAEGSDPLEIDSSSGNRVRPRLVIGGNNNFCTDWATNVAANTTGNPVDPQEPTAPAKEPAKKKSGIGGTAHWMALLLLAGLCNRRSEAATANRRQAQQQ